MVTPPACRAERAPGRGNWDLQEHKKYPGKYVDPIPGVRSGANGHACPFALAPLSTRFPGSQATWGWSSAFFSGSQEFLQVPRLRCKRTCVSVCTGAAFYSFSRLPGATGGGLALSFQVPRSFSRFPGSGANGHACPFAPAASGGHLKRPGGVWCKRTCVSVCTGGVLMPGEASWKLLVQTDMRGRLHRRRLEAF